MAAVACLAAPARAHGDRPQPPSVPANLEVPSTHRLYLVGHAVGTQDYVCALSTSGAPAWIPYGPQATLFDDDDGQIMTHFLSPNPAENDSPRPTWQHSRDSSAVWGMPVESSIDPAYVEPGAIPWLLVRVVGSSPGPKGGDRITGTTYIQRVHTSGGVTPTTACNVGDKKLVPYATNYYFYKSR